MSFSKSDEKIWWKFSHTDCTRVWDPLTCWLSTGALERCFSDSGLTKSLTVCNFRNKVAMTIIFFFKMFKIWFRFQKWNKRMKKAFGFKDNCNWIGDDKFWQSRTGYLSLAVNVLRNTPKIQHITKGDVSKWVSLRVMKKYDESSLIQIVQEFGTL